ncbi:related to GTPase-activating protein beta-chimerin [Cephalotrichum gorgonifer]|uniref:Related to GTPase-activating protein beta-chimerin n=1 Tax=Cephalotrichum gorgonifer TaxID=2041049 RepID=A0AAE8MV36_9PEZI|nr:related to GTPase-activating protein beta-chimerin [Cephalotrichum gorgonifer]
MSLGTVPPPPSGENNPPSPNGAAAPVSISVSAPNPPAAGQPVGSGPDMTKVQEVLSSEEFALFLKKRSVLEEELSHGLKKVCRMSQENIHRPEHKQGTFAQAYDDMLLIHDRMADNGLQFASSLHVMHDDLMELASIAERNRKGWKVNGLAAEQRVSDIETAMKKSKAKYDSLADEYERVRTGDTSRQSGRAFFKGPKSAAQHEEDLLRKVQAADADYHGKVQVLQVEKSELAKRTRPDAVKAIHDLVRETDAGLTLQMQKFATFNEKHLLSNGLCISPIKNGAAPQQRSLRQATAAIDNEKDLNEYLLAHHSRVPPGQGEVKYERSAVLSRPSQPPVSQQAKPVGAPTPPPGQFAVQPPPIQTGHGPQPGSAPGSGFNSPMTSPAGAGYQSSTLGGGQQPRPTSQQQPPPPAQHPQPHNRTFSTGAALNQFPSVPQHQQQDLGPRNPGAPGNGPRLDGPTNTKPSSPGGAPQLGALSFQPGGYQAPPSLGGPQAHQRDSGGMNPLLQNPSSSHGGGGPSPLAAPVPVSAPAPVPRQQSPPMQVARTPPPAASESKRIFGVDLLRLHERDTLVVPMVVIQCIQAVDLFGLNMEGIYRQSGSLNSINGLKAMFDADSTNPKLDFRNPENFFHDVNSVTGLLKQFFRDLPDPLLTNEHHKAFIDAAKQEDDTVRRDSLHLIINDLPDPNYATLRALTLHLHRVMENSHINRMTSYNLGVIFGPTLMGSGDPSTGIQDAGWQIKVVETILDNTYNIFDDE